MASSPTVVTSRRRQHELLRSWTGWPLTSVLIAPAEVAQVRDAGWSGTHHRDPETGERIVGTADGLGFGVDDSWHNPVEVIPWSELEAIARAVPEDVREQLVEFRARWRQHQSAYPRFTASAAAVGCGPTMMRPSRRSPARQPFWKLLEICRLPTHQVARAYVPMQATGTDTPNPDRSLPVDATT